MRAEESIFIVFEGIDGAGKTTQVELLEEFFRVAGETVVKSKEPTDGVWGRRIRESASKGRLPPDEELRAFIEDRKEHVGNLILPALTAGKVVILDRYFYSTIAYQASCGASASRLTTQMKSMFPVPDIAILIDTPAEIGLHRVSEGRGDTPNSFENIQTLQGVRAAFLNILQDNPEVRKIDGTRNIQDVRRDVVRLLLDGVLKEKRCAKRYGCDQPEYCVERMSDTCRLVHLKRAAASLGAV